jgi:hypothetical protein
VDYKLVYEDIAGRDCPKCRHGMVWLSEYMSIERQEGYVVDDDDDGFAAHFGPALGPGLRPAHFPFTRLITLAVDSVVLFYRNVVRPAHSKRVGESKREGMAETLRVFPKSLICPSCEHIIRDK